MNKSHEQLIILIGILMALVLIVQGIPMPESMMVSQEPVKEASFTPAKKQITSSAVASAFIMPGNTAKVTVNIVE